MEQLLEHGNAYQFTNIEDNTIHGIYEESKADALETRLSIEAILEKRALREIIELCC